LASHLSKALDVVERIVERDDFEFTAVARTGIHLDTNTPPIYWPNSSHRLHLMTDMHQTKI